MNEFVSINIENQVKKGQVPTEYQYWENIEKKPVKLLRKAIKLITRFDPVLPDDLVQLYGEHYYHADPVAEAFVEDAYIKGDPAEGRKMLDNALEHGVKSVKNAPQSLVNLMQEVEVKPDWYNEEMVNLGAKVFRRYGKQVFAFAGSITLQGYGENSVTKPLAFTGTYGGDTANNRFLETASFWVDVCEPGGLEPGGQGLKTALRVRIMHVFVRQRLLRHPEWDLEAWGVPISQADAMVALMGASVSPGLAFWSMGYQTSKKEIEALLHFWRYVGHLVGVQPRWFPETVEDGVRLLFTNYVKSTNQAGEDGVFLSQSYVESYAPKKGDPLLKYLKDYWNYRVQLGYTQFFLPPPAFKHNKLPSAGVFRFHPLMQAPFRFGLESVRKRSSNFDRLYDWQVRNSSKRWVKNRLQNKPAKFEAVAEFTR